MKEVLEKQIKKIVQELFGVDTKIVLTRPEPKFGDFSTNVAMQLGGQPAENAAKIVEKLKALEDIDDAVVAGLGFINITIVDKVLQSVIGEVLDNKSDYGKNKIYDGKTIVAEYSDPNPFKVLHAGHLYTSLVGDAIANLLDVAGAKTHRVNYGGDVGLHAAKTMWAIIKKLGGENPGQLEAIKESERSEWMASAYVEGTNAYEDDETAKQSITILNTRIYKVHSDDDHVSPLGKLYWTCRQWSYDYFNEFYSRIGTKFEKYYHESEVADLGLKIVNEQLAKGVFEKSDGAVIFKGEDYGLHTRVFINSEGIPTYEAKDIGLIFTKKKEYNFDRSVVITGNEQEQYMQVVLKAVEQFAPELVKATTHLTHGMVKLQGGVKMSSRKGNILRAVDVLDVANEANKKANGGDDQAIVLGAVKYSFLKQRTGGDIIYDPDESVSIAGNSGPYLQYAHARAMSILGKKPGISKDYELDASERQLVRKISEFPEVVEAAVNELMPHLVCTFLYELAQEFNSFYESNRILDEPREGERLSLIHAYAQVLKNGLGLLGISAPDHM